MPGCEDLALDRSVDVEALRRCNLLFGERAGRDADVRYGRFVLSLSSNEMVSAHVFSLCSQ
jgi:hypothetical protein